MKTNGADRCQDRHDVGDPDGTGGGVGGSRGAGHEGSGGGGVGELHVDELGGYYSGD